MRGPLRSDFRAFLGVTESYVSALLSAAVGRYIGTRTAPGAVSDPLSGLEQLAMIHVSLGRSLCVQSLTLRLNLKKRHISSAAVQLFFTGSLPAELKLSKY